MGVRSVNNTLQSFLDTFIRSGTDAVGQSNYSQEYVLFGGTTGTITIPATTSSIKIAGSGGGAPGVAAGPAGFGGEAGGGGAASNIVGNTYTMASLPGVTSLYYSVGASGADTFVKQNTSGGADIIRLVAGSGTTGGPVTGGGSNAVAGGSGGAQSVRYGSGSNGGAAPAPGGCGGGGGGGGITNNGQPGTSGGAGGSFTGGSAIQRLGSGPAPNSWSFNTNPVNTTSLPLSATTQGQNLSYAYGGVSYIDAAAQGAGRGGGAGVGIQYNDPTSPENGNYFGGGGGGDGSNGGAGAYPSTNARQGGKGILVIQLT